MPPHGGPPRPLTWAASSSCFLFSSSVSTSLCLVSSSSLLNTSALSSACVRARQGHGRGRRARRGARCPRCPAALVPAPARAALFPPSGPGAANHVPGPWHASPLILTTVITSQVTTARSAETKLPDRDTRLLPQPRPAFRSEWRHSSCSSQMLLTHFRTSRRHAPWVCIEEWNLPRKPLTSDAQGEGTG